jgi:hypothetical protein
VGRTGLLGLRDGEGVASPSPSSRASVAQGPGRKGAVKRRRRQPPRTHAPPPTSPPTHTPTPPPHLHDGDERSVEVVRLRRLGVQDLNRVGAGGEGKGQAFESKRQVKEKGPAPKGLAGVHSVGIGRRAVVAQQQDAARVPNARRRRRRAPAPAGDGEDGAVEEVAAELFGVKGGASDDELEVRALLDDLGWGGGGWGVGGGGRVGGVSGNGER